MTAMEKLWAFLPNWRESYTVEREFKTDMTASRAGGEQRRALRSTPRKSVAYTTTVRAETMTALHQFLGGWQHQTIRLPDLFASVTTGGMASGAAALVVGSVPAWLTPGARVALRCKRLLERREVQSVAGTTVTFTGSSATTWPEGTMLLRTMKGTLAEELNATRPTNGVAELKVDFSVEPASEPLSAGAAGVMFNGRELVLKKPNWADAPNVTFSRPSETVDYGRGRISRITPIPYSTQIKQMTFIGRTASEIVAIEQLFDRMKGQRGEFYMPTWDHDLAPKTPALVGESVLRISGRELVESFAGSTVYRAIIVFYRDGTYQARRVQAIEQISDVGGQDSVVRVASPFTRAVDPAEVLMICWLPVWRFASDILTTEYLTSEVGRFKISVKTLEDLAGQ